MSYAPPTIRPSADLSLEDVIKTIPWSKFQINKNFLALEPVILVASGSFSPISTLHVQMMTMIREFLMVSNQKAHVIGGVLSPVSDGYGKASLIDENHRLEMCRLATNEVSWLGPTSVEIKQGKWVETRLIFDQIHDAVGQVFKDHVEKDEVVVAFDESNPPSSISTTTITNTPQPKMKLKSIPRLVFCMGSDVFLGFRHESWWSHKDVELYCTRYRLAVIVRGDDIEDVKELLDIHPVLRQYTDSIYIIPPKFTNSISSTLIRNQIGSDASLYGLVHPSVEEYMKKNQLYGYGNPIPKQTAGGEAMYESLFLPE